MGNNIRPTAALKTKHVVIVGGSYSGFSVAQALWDYFTVTIIDKNDYWEHVAANVKNAVDPTFPDRVIHSQVKQSTSFKGKYTFKQATLTNVNKDDTIEVKNPDGISETIKFDYLVIATGFCYDMPIRSMEARTETGRREAITNFLANVEDAKSILVVGGGLVGVELTSEFAFKYGAQKLKRIELRTKGDRLLRHLPIKAGATAEQFLRENNVEIKFKTPFNDQQRKETIDFDLVLECTGYNFDSSFLKQNFSNCISSRGQIFVNDLMQISGVDPRINSTAKSVKENIYALGDCQLTSVNETKSVHSAKMMSVYVIENIISQALGRAPSAQLQDKFPNVALISLGPQFGMQVINGLVFTGTKFAENKMRFTQRQKELANGNMQVNIDTNKRMKKVLGLLNCMTCCCFCCPCSNRRSPYTKAKQKHLHTE